MLVVVGLLIGSITISFTLIENAQIKRTITEWAQYEQAYNKFRDTYDYDPGDIPASTNAFGSGEKYGNGDGDVKDASGSSYPYAEPYLFWRQLHLAGLIEKEYTCNGLCLKQWDGQYFYDTWATLAPFPAGITVPKAPLPNTVFNIRDWRYEARDKMALSIGLVGKNNNGAVGPKVAAALDTKMDDGYPRTGKLYTVHQSCSSLATQNRCFTNYSSCYPTSTSEYDFTYDDHHNCYMQYILDETFQ